MEKTDVPSTTTLSVADLEILKLRTKYAWDVWDFHGRQRITMFNFFLLITGILVNGYLMALDKLTVSFPGVLPPICLLGMLQCLAFFMIDIRNRNMLYFADDLLKGLESDYVSPSSRSALLRDAGPMVRRDQAEPTDWWLRNSKMMYWIRGIYLVVALGFLASLADSIWLLIYHKHLFA
jgi:cytochrome c oxidase subunit IV